jgi:hypothetical protein
MKGRWGGNQWQPPSEMGPQASSSTAPAKGTSNNNRGVYKVGTSGPMHIDRQKTHDNAHKQGKCFQCGDKYEPGHMCAAKQEAQQKCGEQGSNPKPIYQWVAEFNHSSTTNGCTCSAKESEECRDKDCHTQIDEECFADNI